MIGNITGSTSTAEWWIFSDNQEKCGDSIELFGESKDIVFASIASAIIKRHKEGSVFLIRSLASNNVVAIWVNAFHETDLFNFAYPHIGCRFSQENPISCYRFLQQLDDGSVRIVCKTSEFKKAYLDAHRIKVELGGRSDFE